MFRTGRWRNEKNKIKAVFKLQFRVSQIPKGRWEAMWVSLVPMDTGKPTERTEKALVAADGSCQWTKPIYGSTKLVLDPKSGKISEKFYQIIIASPGKETKNGVLGEVTIDLADYSEAFKPSYVSIPLKAPIGGASLHVTIHRLEGDGEKRVVDENRGVARERLTLQSQLCNSETEEDSQQEYASHEPTDLHEEGLLHNGRTQPRLPSSRTVLVHTDSNTSETVSASSSSDTSSGQYTPNENGFINCSGESFQDSTSLLSPLSIDATPRNKLNGLVTTLASGSELRERLLDPDVTMEMLRSVVITLARQVDISELELQSLRKQIVKERKQGLELSNELSSLQKERDKLLSDCKELQASCKKMDVLSSSTQGSFENNDLLPILEEVKQELDHEKNLNANLHVQLQKMQESNSELILAVRDLEELLDQKSRGDLEEPGGDAFLPSKTTRKHLAQSDGSSDHDNDKEQYTLEILVKEHDNVAEAFSLEKKIVDLKKEIDLYKKEREELEMQMEQLALDYEIMRQENHDLSSKLEQSQLRDQLRMQYDCSAHLAHISELEANIEVLEKELVTQADGFAADLEVLTIAKVEQEKRAIVAEELLRKTRCSNTITAEKLHDDFKKLSSQLSCSFAANEKLAMKATAESNELRLEKCQLEGQLQQCKEQLVSVKRKFQLQFKEILCHLDVKAKETDGLLLELNRKNTELENLARSSELNEKMFLEEISVLKAEIELLKEEKNQLLEQVDMKEKLVHELERLEAVSEFNEKLVRERNIEIASEKQEANKSLQELDDMRHMIAVKDANIVRLSSQVQMLHAESSGLSNTLLEKETEKENLRIDVFNLRSELHSTTKMLSEIDIKLRQENAGLVDSAKVMKSKITDSDGILSHNSSDVHVRESIFEENIKDLMAEDCSLLNTNGGRIPEIGVLEISKKEVHSKQLIENWNRVERTMERTSHGDETRASVVCQGKAQNENLIHCEILILKEQNQFMEAELKEMQQRYSEISLRFAEVEGERQQLVMTVRSLKNALKSL